MSSGNSPQHGDVICKTLAALNDSVKLLRANLVILQTETKKLNAFLETNKLNGFLSSREGSEAGGAGVDNENGGKRKRGT